MPREILLGFWGINSGLHMDAARTAEPSFNTHILHVYDCFKHSKAKNMDNLFSDLHILAFVVD